MPFTKLSNASVTVLIILWKLSFKNLPTAANTSPSLFITALTCAMVLPSPFSMLRYVIALAAATAISPIGFLASAIVRALTPLVTLDKTATNPAPPNTAIAICAPSKNSAKLKFVSFKNFVN